MEGKSLPIGRKKIAVYLCRKDVSRQKTEFYLGSRKGMKDTVKRLHQYIHEQEKFFAQFSEDLSDFKLIDGEMRTAEFSNGFEIIWIELRLDPDFPELQLQFR